MFKVKKLRETACLPYRGSSLAAGFDVAADLTECVCLKVGQKVLIPTGLAFEIPEHYEIQIRPRSGLAFKHGITVLNAPGTLDADYRGELKVLLINLGQEDFVIQTGDRIAQIVVQKLPQVTWEVVEQLQASQRDESGFGSTGIKSEVASGLAH